MEHDLYLIQCDHMSGGMCYYAEHGEKCGVPDAVGYDTAAHARKFRTYEDAQTYIDTQMPEWARPSHHPASYRSGSFIMEDAGLRALLNAGVPISDAMLSATPRQAPGLASIKSERRNDTMDQALRDKMCAACGRSRRRWQNAMS